MFQVFKLKSYPKPFLEHKNKTSAKAQVHYGYIQLRKLWFGLDWKILQQWAVAFLIVKLSKFYEKYLQESFWS